jgi:hypothetical protein
MKKVGGYGQFCPVAMAAEVLCTRWTVTRAARDVRGQHAFQ